ncbi:MAG TPA: deoxyribodipyrimidine photo-lyase [Devosia sp.]|jgi:deoxyribodipyrimidine photo-lyase|uniref:cryptochrome/photolyase family protein n=1 Tax=Devosia sp. TaxID=1871048 RepID=UPI002F953238
MGEVSLVWLRNDLRLADNPALFAAHQGGGEVLALYVHEAGSAVRAPGAAARWWLHHSLNALGKDLAEIGIKLLIRQGEAASVVCEVAREHGASQVFWNRRYAPAEREIDASVKTTLKEGGVDAHSFPGNVLVEPWEIATGQGKPYSVYTPFWKNLRNMHIPVPLGRPAAQGLLAYAEPDSGYQAPKWSVKLKPYWSIGEQAAALALTRFLDENLSDYPQGRDFPRREATSRLSPHLRFGEISVRQLWHTAQALAHADHRKQELVDKFLSELAWRDFNYHQLYHRTDIATAPMQPKYAAMPWRVAARDLAAWQQGRTGIPLVDAGMREMWETGFMQNRVRMLTASLLTKNLLVDWRQGEQWFWDCLIDADIANNPANWQWVAGSGMDASPYFRIFNPVTQGERFDAEGDYVRRWVPELDELPDPWIHQPWAAPGDVLAKAGVQLGSTYPLPIVDLKQSRQRALDAVRSL